MNTPPAAAGASAVSPPAYSSPKSDNVRRMEEIGTRLVATYTIEQVENEATYPITVHQIDVPALLEMFKNMFTQLIEPVNSGLGFADPTSVEAIAYAERLATSLAYDAATAAAVVCHVNARRLSHTIVRFTPKPSITFSTFPAYIAALICSIGPIRCDSTPSRRTHVPLIDSVTLENNLPSTYRTQHFNSFKQIQEDEIAFATLDYFSSGTSAWWTFWPVQGSRIQDLDPFVANNRPVHEWTVFSPVQFDDIEDFLKPAVLFAGKPLTKPGLGPWSATGWYEREALRVFTGATPSPSDFPPETREFPCFWSNASAFHATVETKFFILGQDNDDDNTTTPPATGQKRGRFQMSRVNQSKRRKMIVTPERNNDDDQDGRIPVYRIVYHYFDHICMRDTEPSAFKNFLQEACRSI